MKANHRLTVYDTPSRDAVTAREYIWLMHSRDRFAFVAAIRLGMSSAADFSYPETKVSHHRVRGTRGCSRRGFDYAIFTRSKRVEHSAKSGGYTSVARCGVSFRFASTDNSSFGFGFEVSAR